MHPEGNGFSLAPPPGRLALAAIVRNEGPYLLEWIAHHRALGIGRFFIADNDSTDETTATLAALAHAGIVDYLPFPSSPGTSPHVQLAAYEEILRRHGSEADWIAFLDADEFLVPAPQHRSVAAVIAATDPGPDVGAIAVNWAIYGSSGQRAADNAPVSERFVRRAPQACGANHHYKLIVRAGAIRAAVNPHFFLLCDGLRSVHADGSEVTALPHQSQGLSARILWEPLRINHYVVKSWEEFRFRKQVRGRAMRAPRRLESFFLSHDRNEILDPMPAWLVRETAAVANWIVAALRACGAAAISDRSSSPSGWKTRLRALLVAGRPKGAVEAIEIIGDLAQIRGWAVSAGGQSATDFTIALDGRPAAIAGIVRSRRCDVVARLPEAAADCGFLISIAWPHAVVTSPTRNVPGLTIAAHLGTAGTWELPTKNARWLGISPEGRPTPVAAENG